MSSALKAGLIMVAVVLLSSLLCGGCAYMQNRGNDALDIFDVGLTVTKQPHVGAYAGFNSILGLGYADMDGKLIGLGERQFGILDMRYNAGGMLLEAHEQIAYGEKYEKADPDSPKDHGVGLGMIYRDTPKSFVDALECPKVVHLLFIGVDLTCKIGEIADFLAGWTTLDISHDDVYPKTAPGAS